MRKRLIDKAFAVAMTGAMAFTATPVTANIFNVAHVVKAAEADQASAACSAACSGACPAEPPCAAFNCSRDTCCWRLGCCAIATTLDATIIMMYFQDSESTSYSL